MKLSEAYSILEIPEGSSPDDAKKRYRQLTKKYHPDINKEPDAEEKFKKINEAYQVVSSGKSTDREDMHAAGNPFVNIDPFNPFASRRHRNVSNINVEITISFAESVLGCKKDLKYNRQIKCQNCNGNGHIQLNNGCTKCGGRGQLTGRNGNMMFIQTCDQCYGKVSAEACKTCNSNGVIDVESSISVTIPGGIQDSNILRLGGMGHFITTFGPMDQHTDVHMCVHVNQENGLRLKDNDVISEIDLDLLEALVGCKKTVKTVIGTSTIEIKPKSKNKDEVLIRGVGVNRVGNQRVIINVNYPNDVSKLINILSESIG